MSFRNKLLAVFLTFSVLSILLAICSTYYFRSKYNLADLTHRLYKLQVYVLEDLRAQSQLFRSDENDLDYFKTHKSELLNKHDLFLDKIQKECISLSRMNEPLPRNYREQIIDFNKEILLLTSIFYQTELAYFKRGFRDYGAEGKMRESAHELERIGEIPREKLLSLRRHEKDYILRKDTIYIQKLMSEVRELLDSLKRNSPPSQQKRWMLENYADQFAQLVKADSVLGFHNNSGLKARWDQQAELLTQKVERLVKSAQIQQKTLSEKYERLYYGFFSAFISISIAGSFWLAKRFTRTINHLNAQMRSFVQSAYTEVTVYPSKNSDEIGQLAKNFEVMQQDLVDYIHQFQHKVEERTAIIAHQKDELEQMNKELLDSIRYAERLQKSILPNDRQLYSQLGRHALYFQPKDMLSGDFYWAQTIQTDRMHRVFIALADCTGHGVPGAMMSVLAINSLNEIMTDSIEAQPDFILSKLNQKIIRALQKGEETKVMDGLDIGLVMIDFNTNELVYAGASRDLYYQKGNILNRLKGQPESIAGFRVLSTFQYPQTSLSLNEADRFYLFTDGITDQFGGAKGKKFKRIRFVQWLQNTTGVDIELQCNEWSSVMTEWKQDYAQVDDMSFLGVDLAEMMKVNQPKIKQNAFSS